MRLDVLDDGGFVHLQRQRGIQRVVVVREKEKPCCKSTRKTNTQSKGALSFVAQVLEEERVDHTAVLRRTKPVFLRDMGAFCAHCSVNNGPLPRSFLPSLAPFPCPQLDTVLATICSTSVRRKCAAAHHRRRTGCPGRMYWESRSGRKSRGTPITYQRRKWVTQSTNIGSHAWNVAESHQPRRGAKLTEAD